MKSVIEGAIYLLATPPYLHASHIAGYRHGFLFHGILEELTTLPQHSRFAGGANRRWCGACCAGAGGATAGCLWTPQLV